MGEGSTTQDGTGAPVTAIVECDLLIDGVETPSTYLTASGNGSQSASLFAIFSTSSANPVIQLCQRVSYDDRVTFSPWACRTVTVGFTAPPP